MNISQKVSTQILIVDFKEISKIATLLYTTLSGPPIHPYMPMVQFLIMGGGEELDDWLTVPSKLSKPKEEAPNEEQEAAITNIKKALKQ